MFSETVKEIPSWAILNEALSGGSTDIRAALRTFRDSVRAEKGDRQAYLITDTDPNTEDGMFVGFEKAAVGVVEEALRYRQDGVGLNIIMLDDSPHLKQLASALARKNLGRVFFTSPHKLGQVIVEDYLRTKKERL
jgi:Ca-activated chloride channel family protein